MMRTPRSTPAHGSGRCMVAGCQVELPPWHAQHTVSGTPCEAQSRVNLGHLMLHLFPKLDGS